MCLAIPGRVLEIDAGLAKVDFGGVRRRIGVGLVPAVKPGDHVLVHAGFAIQIIDLEEAERQLALIREIDSFQHDGETTGDEQHDA